MNSSRSSWADGAEPEQQAPPPERPTARASPERDLARESRRGPRPDGRGGSARHPEATRQTSRPTASRGRRRPDYTESPPAAGRRRPDYTESPPAARTVAAPARRGDPEAYRPDVPGKVGRQSRGRMAEGEPTSRQQARSRRWWPVITPIAVVAVGLSLLFPAGRHEWALSLFRQREHYTVLSFDKVSTLPVVAVEAAPLHISFTIANLEGRTIRYRYVLSETRSGTRHTLVTSARTLANGASWKVRTVIRPVCPLVSTCLIKVTLPGHPQSIDFFITLVPEASTKHG